MKINDRIKNIRLKKGLTQQEIADQLGVKRSYISMLESGKNIPSEQLILNISRTFNVSYEWLKEGKGEMFCEPQKAGGIEIDKEKDFVTWAIMTMLKDMPEDKKKDVLKYTEEKKQLADFLKNKKRTG